ncbi:hypothetical protein JOC54_002861 [Alkalihalobacillus xiaoxiensis]|uniref:Uncharacterized protein n=1 Tax=Shouchella xiaoxiensis TaxID=766895 RepID=A0ABS2SWN0_9BACI|nr:hypothetical protein [Shouchella xiaoxiensis]
MEIDFIMLFIILCSLLLEFVKYYVPLLDESVTRMEIISILSLIVATLSFKKGKKPS